MAINFPATPTLNQTYTFNGRTWTYNGVGWQATGASGLSVYTKTDFTATAAQTTFTVAYTVGFVDVYYNGSKLSITEYTATNGTSVVLGTACALNDIVETIAWTVSTTLNPALGVATATSLAIGGATIGSNALAVTGTTALSGLLTAAGGVSSTLTTDATSATTGSILTAGGISMQKALWVGTTSNFAGAMTAAAANFSGAIGVGGNAPANANLRGWFAGATNKNIYIGYGGTNAIIQGLSDNLAAYAAIDIDASSLRLNSASGGLVGIGMTPSNVLDITQNQNGASVIKLLNNSAGANAQAVVQLSDGTNNAYMAFFGTGGAGTGPNNPGSFSIQTQATGGMNIATTAAYPMKFHINNAEAARITPSSTSFLIGKTANGIAFAGFQANYSTGQTDVTVSGSECMNICRTTSYGSVIRFFQTDAATLCGSIATSAGATAYNTSSDYRLKENVQPMTGGLDTIAALKPVTYDWKADQTTGEGFIAHELQAVIPRAVTGDKDALDKDGNMDPQGVDFSKIVPHLVAAIQELTTRLAALESK